MSRDVITVGSTTRIPLLYRGKYSQWRERFMNYLEEQTDGEAMINSIQNGDQPLPVIAQVSLAETAQNAPPTLKDPNNETAKDLWDALERQMRGSKYGEKDRKAAFCMRDVNDALGYKKKAVVVHSDPLALVAEKKNVNKRKEKVVVSSDSEGSGSDDFIKVKDYEYYKTKLLLAKKDKDEQVLLVEDQAWMESSSDSDQEINANMVFMAQIEKVLSDSEASSLSADEKIFETVHMIMPYNDILYNGRKGIGFENSRYFEKAKDLRPSLYDEKVIGLGSRENKIEFAYDYGNLNASYVNEKINFEDDYFQEMINPNFDKIDSPFQQTSSLKPYVPNVILEKIIIDLEDEVLNLLEKEKANLETIQSLKSKSFESSEKVSSESENQNENDCHKIKKVCDNEENPEVIAPGMFKLNVSQCVSPVSMSKSSSDSDNVKIKLKIKRRKRKSSKQNVKQVDNDVSRANSDFVHFLDLDTFSSVRRPKNSGVIWKKKGSSNTSNVGETSCASVCDDAMNVSCNPRINDLLDDNNFFIFDDVNVRISPVSKMPFRKKPPAKWFPTIVQIYLWIIDSGCSKHMTGNRALLMNFVEKFLGTVCFGNNDFAVIAGYGDVVIDGVDLLTGDRSSNLYTIALNEVASNSLTCLLAKASSSQSWLWHQRLSHLNFTTINNLMKNNLVQALEIEKFKRSRENKIKFAYDYGNLNASYVNEKINFKVDYFQEIINPDFEKIDYAFQQTSSLKLYVSNVILEKIIIDLEDEVVNLLEK
nr:hypothetical protein [Tanacetum cinerariifolium]